MADTSLLGDLCVICHSSPKYRCPRCSARTCSLACSKRHKQWAQCSGTRDPAAYLKRSELATPKSFDQDFNFISGIERTIERADRDATLRGVQLRGLQQAGRRDGPVKGEVQLQRAIEKCGVIIEKAPGGMGRSRNNKTSWNKTQHCISWTVEWVLDDGRRDLGTCLEKDTVSEAFRKQYGPSIPRSKRRKTNHPKAVDGAVTAATNPSERSDRDVSPVSEQSPRSTNSLRHSALPPDAEGGEFEAEQLRISEPTDPENDCPDAVNEGVINAQAAKQEITNPANTKAESTEVKVTNRKHGDTNATDPQNINSPSPVQHSTLDSSFEQTNQIHIETGSADPPTSLCNPPAPARHFYLHLPHPAIPSSKPTLLALSSSATLSAAVRKRIVREYPTIYVLKYQAEDLPSAGFSLQEDIAAELEEEIYGMIDGEGRASNGGLDQGTREAGEAEDLNSSRKDAEMGTQVCEAPNQRVQSQLDDLRYIQESVI